MIGIMGPSGSGKTTLLDVLTGRRVTGTTKVRNVCVCVQSTDSDRLVQHAYVRV